MKKAYKNLKTKKGITIVEVVITLVLIAMVMASAISVIIMSIDIENNSATAVEMKNSAQNVLECFRFAESEEEFSQALSKCGNYQKADDGSYILTGTNLIITVKPNFTENKLEFYATNSDGDEIYSFGYPTNEFLESSSVPEVTSTPEVTSIPEVSSETQSDSIATQEGENV